MLRSLAPSILDAPSMWPDYYDQGLPESLLPDQPIDVLIATYNRCPTTETSVCSLAWLLDSLLEQFPASTGQVFVVDDGSTDCTRAVLSSYVPRFQGRLRILGDGQRRGSSRARNWALREAVSDLVFICDDDCQLSRHALAGLHASYLHQKKRNQRCAAMHLAFYQRTVRPERIVPARHIGFVSPQRGVYATNLRAFPAEYVRAPRWLDKQRTLLAPLGIRHLCGVFLADRRAILDCGGFPEDFDWPNAFCEELELSFRLTAAGYSLYHQADPKFFAVHYKMGWNDPNGVPTLDSDIERRAFGTHNVLLPRSSVANVPRSNSGNRVTLEEWCYSKLVSYFVCFSRRSRRGGRRWMQRTLRQFVIRNATNFYGHAAQRIESREVRLSIWRAAVRDGLRHLGVITAGRIAR